MIGNLGTLALSLFMASQPVQGELVVTPADTAQVVVEDQRIFPYSDLTQSLADSIYKAGAIRLSGISAKPKIISRDVLCNPGVEPGYQLVMQTTHVTPPEDVPTLDGDFDVRVEGVPLESVLRKYIPASAGTQGISPEKFPLKEWLKQNVDTIYFVGSDGFASFVTPGQLFSQVQYLSSIDGEETFVRELMTRMLLATRISYASSEGPAYRDKGYTIIIPGSPANKWVHDLVEIVVLPKQE